jgi:hypothetical protein
LNYAATNLRVQSWRGILSGGTRTKRVEYYWSGLFYFSPKSVSYEQNQLLFSYAISIYSTVRVGGRRWAPSTILLLTQIHFISDLKYSLCQKNTLCNEISNLYRRNISYTKNYVIVVIMRITVLWYVMVCSSLHALKNQTERSSEAHVSFC